MLPELAKAFNSPELKVIAEIVDPEKMAEKAVEVIADMGQQVIDCKENTTDRKNIN